MLDTMQMGVLDRCGLARRPRLSPDICIQLAHDVNTTVRIELATNPGTPQDILVQLAQDGSCSVRYAVARNPRSSPAVLAALLAHNKLHAGIKGIIAQHPNLPDDMLCQLANDADSYVRDCVYERRRRIANPGYI